MLAPPKRHRTDRRRPAHDDPLRRPRPRRFAGAPGRTRDVRRGLATRLRQGGPRRTRTRRARNGRRQRRWRRIQRLGQRSASASRAADRQVPRLRAGPRRARAGGPRDRPPAGRPRRSPGLGDGQPGRTGHAVHRRPRPGGPRIEADRSRVHRHDPGRLRREPGGDRPDDRGAPGRARIPLRWACVRVHRDGTAPDGSAPEWELHPPPIDDPGSARHRAARAGPDPLRPDRAPDRAETRADHGKARDDRRAPDEPGRLLSDREAPDPGAPQRLPVAEGGPPAGRIPGGVPLARELPGPPGYDPRGAGPRHARRVP